MRSIQLVCEAVVDVASHSGNEHFRETVMKSLQVQDTAELSESLQYNLCHISHRVYPGLWQPVWGDKDSDSSRNTGRMTGSCNYNNSEHSLLTRHAEMRIKENIHRQTSMEGFSNNTPVLSKSSDKTTFMKLNNFPDFKQKICTSTMPLDEMNKMQTDTPTRSQFHQLTEVIEDEASISPVDIQNTFSSHARLSANQVVPEFSLPQACHQLQLEDTTSDCTFLFYQLIGEPGEKDDESKTMDAIGSLTKPLTDEHPHQHNTPDMRCIIKHMKYVSPFHELTEGEDQTDFDTLVQSEKSALSRSDRDMLEDPYEDYFTQS